jgi:hypothetical protein
MRQEDGSGDLTLGYYGHCNMMTADVMVDATVQEDGHHNKMAIQCEQRGDT